MDRRGALNPAPRYQSSSQAKLCKCTETFIAEIHGDALPQKLVIPEPWNRESVCGSVRACHDSTMARTGGPDRYLVFLEVKGGLPATSTSHLNSAHFQNTWIVAILLEPYEHMMLLCIIDTEVILDGR
jgi:hypothetical protein